MFFFGCAKDSLYEREVYANYNSIDLYKLFYEKDPKSEELVGEWIEVKGKIKNIGMDSASRPYIGLYGNEIGDVQCFLSKDLEKNLPQVQIGKQITLRGRCLSWVIHLALDDCIIKNE